MRTLIVTIAILSSNLAFAAQNVVQKKKQKTVTVGSAIQDLVAQGLIRFDAKTEQWVVDREVMRQLGDKVSGAQTQGFRELDLDELEAAYSVSNPITMAC